ncbi:ABC transporter permease [Parafrigoribacterium mesophilum]|uniref:ABC transporter permease n=1 Tax=Parafrigoribacterium mesophilum TaxID=433646 RepID=UPI0031FDBBD0
MSTVLAERSKTGRGLAGYWILPTIAISLVLGVLSYINLANLDSIELRALSTDTIITATLQHVNLVVISTIATILIAVPLGIALTRQGARRISGPVLALASGGQAIPSIGVLVLFAILFGIGFWMAVVALVIYALLPVLRNTMVGIQQVDRTLIDAGRGMGMTRGMVLRTIELPLAVPLILAGVRVALILNVGVATLATFTNAGGLGSIITTGIVLNRLPVLVVGSLLTVALALLVDWAASIGERFLRPRGL